ncbi:hypothetical protein GCM10009550_24750 [Actinocorallia libanotica]|uniref:PknH-like protein n=2 Tax=Actinocorallia libanotica TaxID=46162 RepID=A0ABP4BAQ0_9ACTN
MDGARRGTGSIVGPMRIKHLLPAGLAVLVGLGGCAGETRERPASAGEDTASAPAGARTYTSDQLRQALLPEVQQYVRAGEPDSGAYGMLKPVRNFAQLQGQVTLDKPKCATASQAVGSGGSLGSAPAALATFARADGQTITQTLLAVSELTATEEIGRRVPALCRTFRTKVGGRWSTHQVVEATPDRRFVGDGSRTVGLLTMSGSTKVTMWFVVFRGRGYLGTISVYGAKASRREAERIGTLAHEQAARVLP